jgi:hypothetical protein
LDLLTLHFSFLAMQVELPYGATSILYLLRGHSTFAWYGQ